MLRRPTAAANKGGKPRTCRTSAGALTVSPSRNIDEGFGVYPVLVVSVSPPPRAGTPLHGLGAGDVPLQAPSGRRMVPSLARLWGGSGGMGGHTS